jgi:hypothetical protein
MRNSLQSHIAYLERLIQEVGDRLIQPGLAPEEVEDLQLQLFSAQGALEHYRQAYALELSAAGAEPPHSQDGAKNRDGAHAPGKSDSGRAKAGRAAVGARVRKREAGRNRMLTLCR